MRALCAALERIPPVRDIPSASHRFQELIDLLLNVLNFEAVYLLVDGVDAFQETVSEPRLTVTVLEPLLEQTDAWTEQRVFLKLFLPQELRQELSGQLTKGIKVAMIDWRAESLIEVLHARLRAASRGEFDSLDAISDPSLRDAETELLKVISPVPRELLILVNQVIEEHVQRTGPTGGIEPKDVKAAQAWYHRTRSQISSP